MTYLAVLKTSAPYQLLTFSLLFGATTYQSFYSGIVAFKTLDYQNFSALQSKTFPHYFRFQLVASLALLAFPITRGKVAYGSLAVASVGSFLNVFWLGPLSAKLSAARIKQSQIEGKGHKDPTISDEFKSINKQFASAHGKSVGVNMAVFLSLLNYGVWMASKIPK